MGIDGLEALISDESTVTLEEILQLANDGIISRNYFCAPDYWHWDVLKSEKLPARYKSMYETFGEIRW